MKTEKILCSAIWYKDLKTAPYLPKNIEQGVVFSGFRHIHCLSQLHSTTGLKQSEAGEEVQGFLTNMNRFVNREEGAKIALESGQIKKLKHSKKCLFSEDLY